ncbi:hypothetical protein PF010_g20172 [Phytophthora fragariae]|uniref:Ricin B lectin domain-containing protein n=1 Tax=Phytophthora fragariae TaxID=53985 RepID=A0A6G0KFP0_9STRA|nr:hypothetical protein PF010_g20172 [Phytophthora fragariae]
MVIPYGVPIILQSVRVQKNLQNPPGSRKARCLVDNRDVYERVILHLVEDNKVSIQSEHSGRYLQVSASNSCVFELKCDEQWEHFTMECNEDGNLHFVSCYTRTVLTCNDKGVVKCPDENEYYWAAWRIVEPRAVINLMQIAPVRHNVLVGKERQNFILELVKCGKSPDEIEQIVTRMFDAIPSRNAVFAVPVEKKK